MTAEEEIRRAENLISQVSKRKEALRLLDVLQFLPPEALETILNLNVARLEGLSVRDILDKIRFLGQAPSGGGGGTGSGSGDATSIKGKTVDDSALGDGKVLTYVESSDKIEYTTPAGSGDMTKAEYATLEAGKVDVAKDSEKLNGHTESQVRDHAPQSHGNEAHSSTFEEVGNKDQANGYAGLNGTTKLAASQMPTGKIKTTMTFHVPDTLTTDQRKQRILAPASLTITKVSLVIDTAPTGAAVIVDVHKGTGTGTTIFTNQDHRPSIADGSKTGSTTTVDVNSVSEDDEFSVYVDQIGSSVAGTDLTIEIIADQVVAFS